MVYSGDDAGAAASNAEAYDDGAHDAATSTSEPGSAAEDYAQNTSDETNESDNSAASNETDSDASSDSSDSGSGAESAESGGDDASDFKLDGPGDLDLPSFDGLSLGDFRFTPADSSTSSSGPDFSPGAVARSAEGAPSPPPEDGDWKNFDPAEGQDNSSSSGDSAGDLPNADNVFDFYHGDESSYDPSGEQTQNNDSSNSNAFDDLPDPRNIFDYDVGDVSGNVSISPSTSGASISVEGSW